MNLDDFEGWAVAATFKTTEEMFMPIYTKLTFKKGKSSRLWEVSQFHEKKRHKFGCYVLELKLIESMSQCRKTMWKCIVQRHKKKSKQTKDKTKKTNVWNPWTPLQHKSGIKCSGIGM